MDKVNEFSVVFQEEADRSFSVWVPDLPGCASQGDDIEQAIVNIREAIELYLEGDAQKIAQHKKDDYRRQFLMPIQVAINA